jgi:leucyl aminopeptidase
MIEQMLPCVTEPGAVGDAEPRPIHVVRPARLEEFLSGLLPQHSAYLRGTGFAARAHELVLLAGEGGIAAAVLGLGEDRSPHAFGALAFALPEGAWRLQPGDCDAAAATLGFCLGAYAYRRFRPPKREAARLVVPAGAPQARTLSEAASVWMVRDLVNTPANLLGPAELADAAAALAQAQGADCIRIDGSELAANYPAIAAVGRGAARGPVVATLRWRGSAAGDASPHVSLCGKGVCFDSGGYDLKPSAGMLRMKKDMGGAATVLGVARVVMEADLPLRLSVRVGCLENSVSGTAMRPMDVIRTRRGLAVEIGNTDAEGRLLLCDLLAEASDERPDLLLDCATLTGAARVAVGPDLPALFSNHEGWAEHLLQAGREVHDPMWRLPLWDGYEAWLDSAVADLNNVASKPLAGAIVAALFLRKFVAVGTPWAHLDVYAWNDADRPGRPEGGEAQGMRAICSAIEKSLFPLEADLNRLVT